MKRYINIIAMAITTFILTGCYEQWGLENFNESWLQTKPVSLNYLQGEYTGDYWRSDGEFFFQLSDDPDMKEGVSIIDAEWKRGHMTWELVNIPIKAPIPSSLNTGKHYYRLCMQYGEDIAYAKNIESFETKYWVRMEDVQTSSTSAYFTGSTNMELTDEDVYGGGCQIVWRVSSDETFGQYRTVEMSEATLSGDVWRFYSSEIEDLYSDEVYYVKMCLIQGDEVMESESVEFKTLGHIRLGRVTYTDWDGNRKDLGEIFDSFLLNVRSSKYGLIGPMPVEKYGDNSWQISESIPAGFPGTDALYGYVTNGYFQYSEDGFYGLQTVKYEPRNLLWGVTDYGNDGYFDLDMQHMMSRVIFHLQVAGDFPIDKPLIYPMEVSGSNLPTDNTNFYAYYGSFKGNTDDPLTVYNDINLVKGETIDYTIYSFPSMGSGMGVLSLNVENNGFRYKTPIEIDWASGRTYEYTVVLSAKGLEVTDIYVRPWNPVEGGDINLTETNK